MYRVREPQVTSSIVDGEAVIINLDTGNYYSTAGIGAEIWSRISRCELVDEIIEDLKSRFGSSEKHGQISRTVRHFVGVLESENLIQPIGKAPDGAPGREPHRSEATSFEEPVLYRYDDMNELLLLDPIHDVDESGWPKTAETAPEEDRTVSS